MGNYASGCGKKDGCCRSTSSEFHDARSFGKRRIAKQKGGSQRDMYMAGAGRLTANDRDSRRRSQGEISAQTISRGVTEVEEMLRGSHCSDVSADTDFPTGSFFEEGISLQEYVIGTCGQEAIKNFSSDADLHSIRIICLLGEGSFAKVFLVKKHESVAQANYYAMKVLDKNILREKDYFNYVKVERQILMTLDHPFLLKLHYSFQCKLNLYLLLDYEGGGSLFYQLKKKGRF